MKLNLKKLLLTIILAIIVTLVGAIKLWQINEESKESFIPILGEQEPLLSLWQYILIVVIMFVILSVVFYFLLNLFFKRKKLLSKLFFCHQTRVQISPLAL